MRDVIDGELLLDPVLGQAEPNTPCGILCHEDAPYGGTVRYGLPGNRVWVPWRGFSCHVGGRLCMMAAFKISDRNRPCRAMTRSANALTARSDPKFSCSMLVELPGAASAISFRAASHRSRSRQARTTCAPFIARSLADENPNPEFAPVMTIVSLSIAGIC